MSERDAWIERAGLLPRLERIAALVAAEWSLELGPRIAAGRYSYVAPAGRDRILKIVPAEDDESAHDADALALWSGDGAVRLLRQDRERHALLMERARPGHDASALDEHDALRVAVGVGRRLWRPAQHGRPYQWIGERIPGWLDAAGPHELIDAARDVYATLSPRADVLMHGDLHHHNLLRHGEGWVAIDPKPILGEPEWDVVTLLWNPMGHLPTRASIERRIGALAGYGLDAERMRAWAIVRGAYLGLPLAAGETEATVPQLRVARALLDPTMP